MSNVVTQAYVAKRDMTERVPYQKTAVSFRDPLPDKENEQPLTGHED
jgi:hypothetical protein